MGFCYIFLYYEFDSLIMPYQSHSSMVSNFKRMAGENSSICKYTEIGESVNGREISCLKIGTGSNNVLFEGGVHGDEWSGTEMVYMWAEYLLNNRDDPVVTQILNGTTQYCIPMSNPDGHEMKTRKNAHGVDCNRNWDNHFGGQGSSGNPVSQTYRGPYAFSEPETIAYKHLVESTKFERAVSWHSGTEIILFPWGWDWNPTPDDAYFKQVCADVKQDTIDKGLKPYKYGMISTEADDPSTYPTQEAMYEDIARMELEFPGFPKNYEIMPGNKLALYICCGTSVDWYYGNNDLKAWVLEVSYYKTPEYSMIQGYFDRQLSLQIIVSLEAMGGVQPPPGPTDDTDTFVVNVQ